MSDAELASFIQAIVTLHSATSLEERTTADKWLRKWQMTSGAWQGILRLLGEPTLACEIHLMAAIFLRAKLMYDFVQVPPEDHEALCSSLLGFIEQFKHTERKAILKTLALAFADLSIHTCRSWTNFLDVLYETLHSRPDGLGAWVTCLGAVAQENMHGNLLSDPENLKAHTEILKWRFPWVSAQVVPILENDITDVHLGIETLECFIQWAMFAYKFLDDSNVTLFPPAVIDFCFKFIKTKNCDSFLCDRLQECLSKIVRLGSKNPNAHDTLLMNTLIELGSQNGQISVMLSEALEKEDDSAALRLASIYSDACCGSCHKIALLFWQGENLANDLLNILLRLTSMEYDFFNDSRGSNGIVSFGLRFWDRFIPKICAQKKQLEQILSEDCSGGKQCSISSCGVTPTSSRFSVSRDTLLADIASHGGLNPDRWVISLKNLETLLDVLFRTLIRLCWLPSQVCIECECPDLYDFYRFRHNVSNTFLNLCYTLNPVLVFRKLLESLLSYSSDTSEVLIRRHQEAHFYILSQVLREQDFLHPLLDYFKNPNHGQTRNHEEDDVLRSKGTPEEPEFHDGNMGDVQGSGQEVLRVLRKFIETIISLSSSYPEQPLVNVLVQVSGAEVFYRAFSLQMIHSKSDEMNPALIWLADQVFNVRVIHSKEALSSSSSSCDAELEGEAAVARKDIVTWNSLILVLAETASDALRELCYSNEDPEFSSFVFDRLYLALLKFPHLHNKMYLSVLEGLAVIVSTLPDDQFFFQWSSKLLSPYVDAALHHHPNLLDLCAQLDRLSLLLQGLSPKTKERQTFLGEFLTTHLWPLVDRLWKAHPESALVVEACGRVIKHAVRAVKAENFKHLLGVFVSSVITNAKIRLHSTFMYIAEWLITEFSKDLDARPQLQLLFEELARIGTQTLKAQVEQKQLLDKNLVEDFFGLFSRSLRFQPTIPGNSVSLRDTFSLALPCLHHPSVVVVSMTCTFLENCVWVVYTNECEEGLLSKNDTSLVNAIQTLNLLLTEHLEAIVVEIFIVLTEIPSRTILHMLCGVLLEFRLVYGNLLQKALEGAALQCLPVSVVFSEQYKNTIVNNILKEDLRFQLDDLHERCRRANLRQCEAALLQDS